MKTSNPLRVLPRSLDHTRPLDSMTYHELEEEFRVLQRNALHSSPESDWLAVVRTLVEVSIDGDEPTPQAWVKAARVAEVRCSKCSGTGLYYWGGGKKSGPCNRCGAKGVQGQEDFRKNFSYDKFSSRNFRESS